MGGKFKIKPQAPTEPSIAKTASYVVFSFAELRPFSYVEAEKNGKFFGSSVKCIDRMEIFRDLY